MGVASMNEPFVVIKQILVKAILIDGPLSAKRMGGFGFISQFRPQHWLTAIGIVSAPHPGLVAVVNHWRPDIGHLKQRDKFLKPNFVVRWFAYFIIGVFPRMISMIVYIVRIDDL